MGQINLLPSITNTPVCRKVFVAALMISILIGEAPRLSTFHPFPARKKVATIAVSTIIPKFVAALPSSHIEQLEDALKSKPSLRWKRNTQNAGVEIVLASDALFETGSAVFSDKQEPELRDLVQWLTLRNEGFHVTIESHTDDTPVVRHRKLFKTNWELSAARAGAVAGIFQESSFPKNSLEAIGFADSRPLGNNRHQNRRIVLQVTDQTRGGT